jgi:hypothetical protein
MAIQDDLDLLLGVGGKVSKEPGVIPIFLEERYDKIAAIENIREMAICSSSVVAALMHVVATDDEEEVRDAAISTLCEICDEIEHKRNALLIAATDASDRVLTTVLEQASSVDPELAFRIASKLMGHQDRMVSSYAKGIVDRLK